MIKYSNFIKEALKTDQQKFLQNVYNIELALFDADKLTDINIKQNELKMVNDPFVYKNFASDQVFLNLINNKNIGFPVTANILNTINVDKNNETIFLDTYCKNTEDSITYIVGIIMYDTNKKLIDNYLTILSIESALFLKDTNEFSKIMLNVFKNDGMANVTQQTQTTYQGLAIQSKDNKQITLLKHIGFKQTRENKNILTYKL